MTQSQGPELTDFQIAQAQVQAADLVHELHHCGNRRDALRIFKEVTADDEDDLVLSALIINALAHIEVAGQVQGFETVCSYMEYIKTQTMAPWN